MARRRRASATRKSTLLDELLKGAPARGHPQRGRSGPGSDQAAGGAGPGRRDDRSSRLREACSRGPDGGNSRNGKTRKRMKTGEAEDEIEVPRDRDGSFEPKLVPKGRRRLPGFDDKVIALYARGMTTREIQGGLQEIYGVEVSPSLISAVTDAVLEDVKAWQARPLDPVYPIVYLDAIHVKMRSAGHVQNTAVYVALAINLEGQKELWACGSGRARGRSSGSRC